MAVQRKLQNVLDGEALTSMADIGAGAPAPRNGENNPNYKIRLAC